MVDGLAQHSPMRPRYQDLFNAMKDSDPVRADEAFDAVLFDRAQALPDLIEAYSLFSDDLLLRWTAVQLLGFSGSAKAVGTLVLALNDPEPRVRAEACRSLEDLKAKDAVEALRARANDVDPDVRQAAQDALQRI
jgi:HEAT repeat protein